MDQQRFDELLQAELDGVITDAEAAELDEACEANRDFCVARDRDARLVTLLRSRGSEPAPPDLIAGVMARILAEPATAPGPSIADQDTVALSDETIREAAQVNPLSVRKTQTEPAPAEPTPDPKPQPVRRPERAREASRPSIWSRLFGTPLRWGFGMAVPAVVVFMLLEMGRQESEIGAGKADSPGGGGGSRLPQIALLDEPDDVSSPAEALAKAGAAVRDEFEIASAPTPRAEENFFARAPGPAPGAALESSPDVGSQSPPIFTPPEALALISEPTLAEIEPRTIASALPQTDAEFAQAAKDAAFRAPVRSDGTRVWSPPPAVSEDLIPDRAAEIPAEIQIAGLPENVAETRANASLPSELPGPAEVDIAALSQLPVQTDLERALAETRTRVQARRTIARTSDPIKPANAASARRSVTDIAKPKGPEGLNLEIHLASARAQSSGSRTTIPSSRSGLTIRGDGTRRSLSGGGSQTRRSGANGALTARRISYLLIRHGTLIEDRPDEKDPTIQHIRARLTRAGYEAFLIDLREAGLARRTTGAAEASTSDASAKAGWFATGTRTSSGVRADSEQDIQIVIQISVHSSP